jgi:hypothetical protein
MRGGQESASACVQFLFCRQINDWWTLVSYFFNQGKEKKEKQKEKGKERKEYEEDKDWFFSEKDREFDRD